MPQVTPIAMTQVDWTSYLRTCMEVLKSSPSRILDSCNIPAKTPFGYLASIAKFEGSTAHPVRAVKELGYSLRHFHFGFLIECSESCIIELSSHSDLVIGLGCPSGLYLVSGDLLQWRQVIVMNMVARRSEEIRELLSKVMAFIEQAGLSDIFTGFYKREGFLLEAT